MRNRLNQLFKKAIHDCYGEKAATVQPAIQLATRAEFGDYQANFTFALAKLVQQKPADVAKKIMDELQNNTCFKLLELSGPGFINIYLDDAFLASELQSLKHDKRLGIEKIKDAETVVIDYANANVAKEMHVGHIRSIVIGDAIVRILDFLGHPVIRQSHLGDWGTQFGMLIEYLFEIGEEGNEYSVSNLDHHYKKSKERFDQDEQFADKARLRVVALQTGDAKTRAIWQRLVNESLQYFQKIYNKLDVLVTEEDARGESFYNDMLPDIVSSLKQMNIATISDGATVVFFDHFPAPFIIQKKDGGYLYATTDIAAAKFRIETLHAKRLIYLTDARQKQHFAMLFAVLRQSGIATDDIRLEHIPFGAILGKDNKPFKTRSGESIKLISLLDEAENKAMQIAQEKNSTLSADELQHAAHHIGIGALKYADLRADKIKDYVFDWDKLLAFEGNTAPYLQNAYVRIRALFRRGNKEWQAIKDAKINLATPAEHALAVKILEFPTVIYTVSDNLSLHSLCDYLYDLAASFHQFYEQCPILSADDATRDSRLALSYLTAETLALGLNLLGISVLEKM